MNITQKLNHCFALLLVVILLGCAAPATPTLLPASDSAPALEPTLFPTLLASATETVMPTTMPEAPLRTAGPYFSYFRQVNGEYQLVLIDADAEGMQSILLPSAMAECSPCNGPQLNYISPDGQWLAYYSGYAGDYSFNSQVEDKGIFDLTLNLFNLKTGDSKVVTALLSKDYPNNFLEAEKQSGDPNVTHVMLRGAFLNGITRAIAWSPDGKHLAFAGQMDGLSSDLYVYDLQGNTIQRLSSGDQELQWISWSPDGKQIVHASTFQVNAGMNFDIYVATLGNFSVRYLSTSLNFTEGVQEWVAPHLYLENDAENGPGRFGLRLIDINSGKITQIWKGSYGSYAVDATQQWLALTAFTPADMSPYLYEVSDEVSFMPGLYLVNLKTLEISYPESENGSNMLNYLVRAFDAPGQLFVLDSFAVDQKPYFLSSDGRLTALDIKGNRRITLSPNPLLWATVTNKTVDIYSVDNTLVNSIELPLENVPVRDLLWNPDASGLFLVYGSEIYFVNIMDTEPKLIAFDLIDTYYPTYTWIDVR